MRPCLIKTQPARFGLHPRPVVRQASRQRLQVSSLTLPYQYQARADKLRKKGYEIYEFGDRVMREGCFGEDVLQLQNYLAEEEYYNPVNGGYTGYFGGVTKQSLQEWQKDHGLEPTGVFNSKCKWAYLKEIEAQVAEETAAAAAAVQKEKAATTNAPAVVASKEVVAPSKQAKVAVPASAQPTPAIASSSSSSWNPFPLLLGAAALYGVSRFFLHRRGLHFSAAKDEQDYYGEEGEMTDLERAAAFKRLSQDELQKFIAPMKGEPPSRTPVQRPPLRPLRPITERSSDSSDPFLSSKYGSYYGGKQVLDKVKRNLADEGLLQLDAANAAAKRLEMITKQSQQTPKRPENQAKPAAKPPAAQQQNQAVFTPRTTPPQTPTPSPSTSSFEDVEQPSLPDLIEAAAAAAAPVQQLLAGTELEKPAAVVSEPTPRPVNVQRPSRLMPNNGSDTNGSASSKPIKSRPVNVVRPDRRGPSTIAEAMKALEEDEEYGGMPPPAAGGGAGSRSFTSLDQTVVLEDKPIKLHKPARLVMGKRSVPQQQWEAVLSEDDGN